MEAKGEKLSWWTKIGYGMGDIYGGGASVVISFYYLIFLTDVVGIAPALAGTVMLVSKIYDSITDPFEGLLADRTRGPRRSGRGAGPRRRGNHGHRGRPGPGVQSRLRP